jgi:putative membrane protein
MILIILFLILIFFISFYIDYGHLLNKSPVSENRILSKDSGYLINTKTFITYKFINTMFMGIAIGSYVTQYKPIKIDDYPIMGIIFAFLTIGIASLYKRIMKIDYFFKFLLTVELIMLVWIIFFLVYPYSYQVALLIYIARSITFLFGDFLGRAETIFLNKTEILSSIDIFKQIGNISGMILSVLFYKWIEETYLISDNESKVYYIHFILASLQVIIIFLVFKSFRRVKN